jgi:uncharacterized protein YndB with AHSA1/START domain
MLTYILIALAVIAVLIIVFVVIVAMQPADFRIARSSTFTAPPADVFAQVNDFHRWDAWSPWAKIDPSAKNTFAGAPSGTGAVFSWSGNNKVGEGTMTITESRPNDLIAIKLEFRRPFKATNTAEFAFKADGKQTTVTWSMSGRNSFMFKAFGLFMNMDKVLGAEFEKGLANMKAVVEAGK